MLLVKKFKTRTEIVNYLMENYSTMQLINELADRILEDAKKPTKKVTVSQEDLDAIMSIFKLRGVKTNGETETRGRKKSEN